MPKTEIRPKQLRSAQDVQDWNEWMANAAADGKISPVVLNGLNKVLDGAIKINMKIPLEYLKIVARSGKQGLPMSVPWIEDTMKKLQHQGDEA